MEAKPGSSRPYVGPVGLLSQGCGRLVKAGWKGRKKAQGNLGGGKKKKKKREKNNKWLLHMVRTCLAVLLPCPLLPKDALELPGL